MLRRISAVLTLALLLAACAGQPAAVPTAVPAAPTEAPAAPTAAPTAEPTEAPVAPAAAAISVTDSAGRSVDLAGVPQTIVSLAPSTTEILFALGAGGRVVAVDDFSNYPPEVASLPKVGGMTGSPNYEQIAALEPNLVLAAGITAPEVIAKIEELGIPIAVVGAPEASMETIFSDIRLVGQLVDAPAEALTLTDEMRVQLATVTDRAASAGVRPRVYWELDATDPSKPFSVGPGSFVNELIGLAGGENVFAAADSPYPQVSAEQVVAANPDVILLASAQYGVAVESVGQRPGWGGLAAVTGGRVYPLDADLVSRPGPRIAQGLESVAKLLHPAQFP